MKVSRIRQLMEEAIREAANSKSEDARVHPKVGAILADSSGKIIGRAHRGEVKKQHAEHILLNKAKRQRITLQNTVLFTTLEPCIRRGRGKAPCARQVIDSGIPVVYIGTLDPDPRVGGRGEIHLAYRLQVDRFPKHLQVKLRQLNREFFDLHKASYEIVPSLLSSSGTEEYKLDVARNREGILLQTADLIAGSKGPVWIAAGDLSWIRELQPILLLCAYDGREIRILRDRTKRVPTESDRAARAIGCSVAVTRARMPLRGTLTEPHDQTATLLMIERDPSLHGVLFRRPEDARLVSVVEEWYEAHWRMGSRRESTGPDVVEVTPQKIISKLRKGISFYRNLELAFEPVAIEDVLPLAKYLERFKLFRLSQLHVLRTQHGVPGTASVRGSPWGISPPVIECLRDGRMVVIDGAHRVFEARGRGEESILAILVRHVEEKSLPAEPLDSWESVVVDVYKHRRRERYQGFKASRFRPIRDSLRNL